MKNLLLISKMLPNDYVGFTFFVGCMAMMAASAFFFLSLNQFDKKWRTSVLVSGLITFIAAVHYFYMRDYWAGKVLFVLLTRTFLSPNQRGRLEPILNRVRG